MEAPDARQLRPPDHSGPGGDWHGLKVKSVHLNAPSESLGGSKGTARRRARLAAVALSTPSGEGREGEGPRFYFSPGWSPGAGFPLNEDERGRSQGEFWQAALLKDIPCDSSALPAPERGGSQTPALGSNTSGFTPGACCPKNCAFSMTEAGTCCMAVSTEGLTSPLHSLACDPGLALLCISAQLVTFIC